MVVEALKEAMETLLQFVRGWQFGDIGLFELKQVYNIVISKDCVQNVNK